MDDGKSIRYKDLHALFEQILEKTMRQEQRDWRESPVTVWVNTFKVFLDEFMAEYKTLDSMQSKVQPLTHKLGTYTMSLARKSCSIVIINTIMLNCFFG